jgi:Domain of unknown function (DUF4307)
MSDLLTDRYGTSKGRRRGWVPVAILVAVVGLAWLAWAAIFHSTPAIEAEVASYDVRSAHEVQVKLTARVDEGVTGRCLIRATAFDHTIVGEKNVRVHDGSTTTTLRTERRATAVSRIRCVAD